MIRCILLLILPLSVFSQNKAMRGSMFSDLEVTNTITKAYPDSTLTFSVKMLDDDVPVMNDRFYTWFFQDEIKLTQGAYAGKLLHGAIQKFDRKGNLIGTGNYSFGLKSGSWMDFFPNGSISRRYNWQEGYRVGSFQDFYPHGAVKRTGQYRQNKLNGKISTFNPDGSVLAVENYRKGKLQKVKEKPKTNVADTAAAKQNNRKELKRKARNQKPSITVDQPLQPAVTSPVTPETPVTEKNKKSKRTRKEKVPSGAVSNP